MDESCSFHPPRLSRPPAPPPAPPVPTPSIQRFARAVSSPVKIT
jgi:hypothetical protein